MTFHRTALALLLICGPRAAAAQDPGASLPSCRTTLDSLDAAARQNYAGYRLEVVGERQADYGRMLQRMSRRADSTALADCHPVLAAYTAWYADPHLFVFQSQTVAPATAAQRAASLRHVAISEEAVRTRLMAAGVHPDALEGIWYDGGLRIAVMPDPDGPAGAFVGVVVASDTTAWPVGAVRAEFRREADGAYATRLLTRDFAELRLTARIHKRVLLRLSPGMWGRAFPLAPADTGLVDPVDVHRPRVSVRARSTVVSIPSHDFGQARLLDSLVRAHAATIAARPLLIVDLRGNEGGSSLMSRALHPYITSTERLATPYDSGAAVMLSSPAQLRYARRLAGTDTSAFVRSLLSRLEANPGTLVPLDESPRTSAAAPADSSIAGNWRVVVLTDGGTVSAAEVLVLRALRSTRAVVAGEPTAGALDYQSVQIISLGTGDRRWGLGYPTIAAHADLPRRGMRGRGIPPQVRIEWNTVADPLAEVERRFAP
jgi:hypothetical protein